MNKSFSDKPFSTTEFTESTEEKQREAFIVKLKGFNFLCLSSVLSVSSVVKNKTLALSIQV